MKKLVFMFVVVFVVWLGGGGEVRAEGGEFDLSDCRECGCVCSYMLPGDGCPDVMCDDDIVCGVVDDECVECPRNTKRGVNGECVCMEGYVDRDGDVANGCEAPICGPNMERDNDGDCVCMPGYRDSDGNVGNGCEDLECSANMERDLNWDCVCSEGFADCDGDVANGCEVEGGCGSFGDCEETGGDYNGDGVFDIVNDLVGWYVAYRGDYDVRADFNCDESVGFSDLVVWYASYRGGA